MYKLAQRWDDSAFQRPEQFRKHLEIPPLIAGFDTETTGLWKPTEGSLMHEPISYGIVVYRNGEHAPNDECNDNLLVKSKTPVTSFAQDVHGFSDATLGNAMRTGLFPLDFANKSHFPPADRSVGVLRTAHKLGRIQQQGGVFVGANIKGFDIDMLAHHFQEITGMPIQVTGFDPETARIVDVIRHHQVMNGDPENYRHALSPKPGQKKLSLCEIYGADPGDHTATADSHAAINVFLKQIAYNRKKAGLA